MTDKERYEFLLGELAERLKEKNDTILCQKWQIDRLEKELEKAEKEAKSRI